MGVKLGLSYCVRLNLRTRVERHASVWKDRQNVMNECFIGCSGWRGDVFCMWHALGDANMIE